MPFSRPLTAVVFALSLSLVAACDSAEERAEKHFQSGMELLQAGDVDRALVEFRNVFQLDGRHRAARAAYAKAEFERGNVREAYAQYLRLVEQYPDDLAALRALGEIAAKGGEWDEADKHATAGLAIVPDDPALLTIRTTVDYGRANAAANADGMERAAARARELLPANPDSTMLYSVIIDNELRLQDYDAALVSIAAAQKIAPDDQALYAIRVSTLAAKGDDAGVEAGLQAMVEKFPADRGISDALVRWYISKGNLDGAESFLRARLKEAAADKIPTLVLVRFLSDYRGPQVAVDELDKIVSANPDPVFRSARAGMRFDLGQREEAIAEMEAILKDAVPSDDTRKIKVALAQMQIAVGNSVAARALVEEVLAEESGNVEAMKLKAQWLIQGDEVGEAIAILRRALDAAPRDASVMTMMAQAYERDGNRDLMREMLALAVDASGNAPDESLRYAQLLVSEGKPLVAETVLIDALRLNPRSPALLLPLAEIYISIRDWPRAEAVALELEGLEAEETTTAAAGIRAAIFSGQQQSDQAIGYLQALVDDGQGGLGPKIAIIRTHLANDERDAALAYAQKILAENPKDPSLRFIEASVRSATGDISGAEAVYRELVAEDAGRQQVWMALFRAVASDPARAEEAGKVLDDALAVMPDAPELMWAKAGQLERAGDVDGAIAVYEKLYAADSSNMIVANNLASLLSTHRTDPESLARAEVIARRLRGSEIGPYQDTYGWIAYRRGSYDEALSELTKAAAALPDDPMVQYHLGMTYLALARKVEAMTQFERAVALIEDGDARPFVAEMRREMDALAAAGISANN
jgi:tetratricopeptide (TPR) repeat protein